MPFYKTVKFWAMVAGNLASILSAFLTSIPTKYQVGFSAIVTALWGVSAYLSKQDQTDKTQL